MSRARGNSRGFSSRGSGAPSRGRGGFSSRGGRGGNSNFQRSMQDAGPPSEVLEMGSFMHAVEGEMLCSSTNPTKVPYFNAPIYLENKSSIGKVDEILGPINQVYFTIKPSQGIQANSFNAGDKLFIAGDKLLPLDRFIPKPKVLGPKPTKKKAAPGSGRGRGMARGRGASRGFSRGAPRGRGFSDRGRGGFGSRGGPPRGRGGFSRGRGRGQ